MIHHQIFNQRASETERIGSEERSQDDFIRIVFGERESTVRPDQQQIALALPLLAGSGDREIPFSRIVLVDDAGLLRWEDRDGRSWGISISPCRAGQLAALTEEIYTKIFEATKGKHLHRMWNFVPQINASTEGLENYRHFCIGRHTAFGSAFKDFAEAKMPAGTAVGIEEPKLIVLFLAGETPAQHFENPLQIPAYAYPTEHSPLPPCFARGSIVHDRSSRAAYISGTASVRGHQSHADGDPEGQLSTTLEMLHSLGATMGLGPKLSAGTAHARQFIVYVRHARHLKAIRSRLERDLFHPGDVVTFLAADICRKELLLEIEGSLQLPLNAPKEL